MYKKILKEETDRVFFQYIDEFTNLINIKPINIDEYLEDIELEIEANEAYDYNNLTIDDHFKNPIVSKDGDSRPNFDAFYKEFHQSVKNAFLTEIMDMKKNLVTELEENREDMEYFKNRDYLKEEFIDDMGGDVSEEERVVLINSYLNRNKVIQEKIKLLELCN